MDAALDLHNPPHTLLGARAAGYPGVPSGTRHGLEDHERRIGRRVHLGMSFARPGEALLNAYSDLAVARRDGTALIQCWKPAVRWSSATGNHRPTTKYIEHCAQSLARLQQAYPSLSVHMVVHHEPENDVGRAGTTEDYRRMYAHVRTVFDDAGADVTWGVAFMNYPKWDRLLPDLWPLERPPDWVWFNAYGSSSRPDYGANVERFYSGLERHRWFDPRGALWGVREWSCKGMSNHAAEQYFKLAAHDAETGRFPRLAAHVVFDSPGAESASELRIGYGRDGKTAPGKAAAYAEFAAGAQFGPPEPP